MTQARAALESLENAGVDGDDLELVGPSADAARTPDDPKLPDRRAARHIGGRLAFGIVFGAIAGALLGLVVGVIAVAITNEDTREVALTFAFVIVGIGLGATTGGFISFERSVGTSEAWPLTFEDAPEGPVWVAVYSHRRQTTERAERELARRHPVELRREAPSLSSK